MRSILTVTIVLILFTSCFKKKDNEGGIFLDFDFLKTVDLKIPNIEYDPNAFSGIYSTSADSTTPYSYTVTSNFKLLSGGSDKKSFKISAQVKRSLPTDNGSIAFQVVDKNNQAIFAESIYIAESNFTKSNEWTKVEGLVNLPSDSRIFEPETTIRVFLFCTKNRIWMDDLEILNQ